jgi:hypothetical protein
MTTLRTEQEVRKLKQEQFMFFLHWTIATADRNIANSLRKSKEELFK